MTPDIDIGFVGHAAPIIVLFGNLPSVTGSSIFAEDGALWLPLSA